MNASQPTTRARLLLGVLVVALSFGALTAGGHGDVLRHGGAGLFDQTGAAFEQNDQLLHGWTLDWVYHQLPRAPLRLFEANAFYPHPYSLALSDHLFGVAVTLLPLRLLLQDPLRLNALGTLLTFVLAGVAVCVLVYSLTGSLAAGWVAGALYAFNPFRVHNLAQIQLLTDYGIPLSFLFLHRYQRSGRAADLVALTGAVAWQTLCSAYMGAFLAVPIAMALFWGMCRRRPARLPTWRALALALLVGIALLAPFSYPYARLQWTGQLRQHILNSIVFSLSLTDIFCWRECSSAFGRGMHPVVLLFALAALWPFGRARQSISRWMYTAVAVIGAAMALGPFVRGFAGPDGAAQGFLFPGPYLLLYRYVPGFDGLRVPARAIALHHFALAVLAGLGAARLIAAARPGGVRHTLTATVIGLVALTVDRPPFTFENPPARIRTPSPVYAWLAQQEGGAPLVEFPVGRFDPLVMYQSRIHRRPVVNGYSGFLPHSYRYIRASLRCYPCPRALRVLADLDVRTHVVHLDLLRPAARRGMEERISTTPSLRVAQRFGDTLVVAFSPGQEISTPSSDDGSRLDPRGWHAISSRGTRGVELALDPSLATFWSTAIDLEDLRHPLAGLRLLRGLPSPANVKSLVPTGQEWFAVDLGAVHAVRRVSLAFSEWGGPRRRPAPTIQGSSDGINWTDLPSDAVVRPSLRALNDTTGSARFEYDWPPMALRHLRVHHPGYWALYDVAVYE